MVYNGLLIAATIGYYLVQGFDAEEFSATITLLTSVSAIYIGTLLQFLGRSISDQSVQKSEPEPPHEVPLAGIVPWIVPLHFLLLMGVLSAKAFTLITFAEMNYFLLLIEGILGAYTGFIIHALFHQNNSPQP